MATTDEKLDTILLMQAEILGRLKKLEMGSNLSPIGTKHRSASEARAAAEARKEKLDSNPKLVDPRFEALAEMEELVQSSLGADFLNEIDQIAANTKRGAH